MNITKTLTALAASSLLYCFSPSQSSAVIIGGIDFPSGATSFADAVSSYSPGTNVGPGWNDPNTALGTPDFTGGPNRTVSLGTGGSLVLQFTDNALTTSGDATHDLHIFEVGSVVEAMNIAISEDGITFIDLGDVSGQPTSLDIDGVAGVTGGTLYSFVRISDILPNQSRSPFAEADIDAVGAISSAPNGNGNGGGAAVPEPNTMALLGLGLVAAFGYNRKKKQSKN